METAVVTYDPNFAEKGLSQDGFFQVSGKLSIT